MTFVQVLLVVCITAAVISAASAIAMAVVVRRSRRPARGHRVTVHTKLPDDQTIHGVLVKEYRDRLILHDAVYVSDEESPIPGAVRIPAASVSWIQEHE